jgi:hypothetical protein
MSRTLRMLLLVAMSVAPCPAVCQAVISGVVLDSSGVPVGGASVEAFPLEQMGFIGNLHWVATSDDGTFRLSVSPGRYEIRGKHEAQGYPDPNAMLAVDPKAVFPKVTATAHQEWKTKVRLGDRGGIIEGNVRDSETGRPIPNSKVTIRSRGKPQAFVEVFTDGSGRFSYTVPPKLVVISAVANGYAQGFETEVRVSGGERGTVDITLQRKHENP